MTTPRTPLRERSLASDGSGTTSWDLACDRPANPEFQRTSWLATTRPDVRGPHAPIAGPLPYTIYRIVPSKGFGLPGMFGMDKYAPAELPKSTRWIFSDGGV